MLMEITQEIYRSFFDHTNDMIQAVGPDGRFRFVNPRWKDVMGYTSEEVAQLHFEDVLRPDQIDRCRSLFTALVSGWDWEHVETVLMTKDGREIYLEGNNSAQMETDEFTTSLAVFRNVSERIQIETQLRTSLERTQALYEIARSITDYEKLPHLLQIVTDSVAKTLPADRVILYTFDMEKEKIVHFVKGSPADPPAPSKPRLPSWWAASPQCSSASSLCLLAWVRPSFTSATVAQVKLPRPAINCCCW
jgi:PAS domain S-box-containing protein